MQFCVCSTDDGLAQIAQIEWDSNINQPLIEQLIGLVSGVKWEIYEGGAA